MILFANWYKPFVKVFGEVHKLAYGACIKLLPLGIAGWLLTNVFDVDCTYIPRRVIYLL